ncbi:MAG: OmpA family protein, partial [Bacteroidia bacterium]
QDTTLRVYLEKLAVGSSLSFTNIQFVPDKATILPNALKDFEDLLNFMKTNKNISVEIQGHVNGVGGKKRKQMKLSTDRAKTIYEMLIAYGIEKERLTYKGYGGDKMIYPEPLNEQQSQVNRRVEVRVTSIR